MAGVVLKELFLAMLIDKLRNTPTWIGKLRDESSFVGNNVIHLNEIGADPDVLVNNTVYPIVTSTREDSGTVLSLNKYDTTNTRVSVDELYGLPYDKPGSVIAQHRGRLDEFRGAHGIYTIAPPTAAGKMPILVTTGADDGTGRRRMTPEDLIRLQNAFDEAGIPKLGRVLVLCNEHVMDLQISTLGSFIAAMFQNIGNGTVAPVLYGFELHQDLYAPVYNLGTKTKKAFGAAAAPATDARGSVAFSAPDAFRALGTAQMFYTPAELDAANRSTVCGFQVYGVCAPYTRRSQAAIISGKI